MFDTHDEAEVPTALIFSPEKGARSWWQVACSIENPWFYVVHQNIAEGGDDPRVILYSTPEQLINLASRKEVKILEAQIVTQACLNNQGRSLMEPLTEIWFGEEPNTPRTRLVYVYGVATGKRYADSLLSTPVEQVKNLELVFSHGHGSRKSRPIIHLPQTPHS